MSPAEAQLVSVAPPGSITMEDKKRPPAHNHHDEHAPPRKKQATTVNGRSKMDRDPDIPWQEDLDVSSSPASSAYIGTANPLAKQGPIPDGEDSR